MFIKKKKIYYLAYCERMADDTGDDPLETGEDFLVAGVTPRVTHTLWSQINNNSRFQNREGLFY